jgi:hypothetical protein
MLADILQMTWLERSIAIFRVVIDGEAQSHAYCYLSDRQPRLAPLVIGDYKITSSPSH